MPMDARWRGNLHRVTAHAYWRARGRARHGADASLGLAAHCFLRPRWPAGSATPTRRLDIGLSSLYRKIEQYEIAAGDAPRPT